MEDMQNKMGFDFMAVQVDCLEELENVNERCIRQIKLLEEISLNLKKILKVFEQLG